MERLICFFTSLWGCTIIGRIPLLPRNAKLRQDFFEKSWKSENFSREIRQVWCLRILLENITAQAGSSRPGESGRPQS